MLQCVYFKFPQGKGKSYSYKKRILSERKHKQKKARHPQLAVRGEYSVWRRSVAVVIASPASSSEDGEVNLGAWHPLAAAMFVNPLDLREIRTEEGCVH